MSTTLELAVAMLPTPDAALVPLLRIPVAEIAALRADPGSADLMLRHRIAFALRAIRPDDRAALDLASDVWAAAQTAVQELLAQLINGAIAEGAGPEEMKRRMIELMASIAGPASIEHNFLGGGSHA